MQSGYGPFYAARVPIPVGSRVRVLQDAEYPPGPWPAQPTGTVIEGPVMVEGTEPNPLLSTYTVQFDEPQRDADGDGPYTVSEVLGQYLEPVSE